MGFRSILHGTLWSAATNSVVSLAFVAILSVTSNLSEHYGTSGVALVVMIGVWLFLTNALLLVGHRIVPDT